MGITHEWNGTVLTITSDSGTSSCDLKGTQGDDGARGPQGPAGESADVNITLDTTLTQSGVPAEAKAVGDRLTALEENSGGNAVESVNGYTGAVVLTASDVGAVDTETHESNISGLRTQINSVRSQASSAGSTASSALRQANNAVSIANKKQNAVFYDTDTPTDWVNGDIWLQPAN